ncbi:DUF4136 domain-containing protein [Thalassotalea sp. Y01]|uniref:DUF4136 domain-containing protein n=1 Tax=Thalassotalea sp. Y01 TaxID=2729613 RepID=UPI00145DF833|nr:DUF4136 domain-containing protein [Thalassotalea sp. Y01]NMP15275.1 DUF4136 domain-containing protein [Thalassotalea sp. Y01]
MKFKYLMILVTSTMMVACATSYKPDIDYNPEYDFSTVSTFAVIDPFKADQTQSKPLNRQLSSLDNDRIIKAIAVALRNKGMAEVDADVADTLVRFQVATKDKTEIRTYNTGVYNCWRCRGIYSYPYPVQEVQVKDYTEGTLIIDMIDPKTQKSVWRSVVSKAVKKNVPVNEKQAKIQELVNAMLVNYKASLVPTS